MTAISTSKTLAPNLHTTRISPCTSHAQMHQACTMYSHLSRYYERGPETECMSLWTNLQEEDLRRKGGSIESIHTNQRVCD